MVQIIDRRSKALGGQNNTRSKSAIKEIAWHYTATTNSSIDNHERFWRNNRGWRRGGYHFYIDRDGNIFQNYNLETVSNGVAGHNSRIVNVCCEASRADNYTQAQIDARHELTVWLMDELNIKAANVKQHGEFSGTSTECAGYTKAQMNEFRARLAGGKVNTQSTVKKPTQPKPSCGSCAWPRPSMARPLPC
ncbi:MAG: N-acetylmuramoyl-L-alanine amidase [Verrucomicrobiota bacterium]|jgi:N-acetylmuramoyl-L-alanine amidase CwlA